MFWLKLVQLAGLIGPTADCQFQLAEPRLLAVVEGLQPNLSRTGLGKPPTQCTVKKGLKGFDMLQAGWAGESRRKTSAPRSRGLKPSDILLTNFPQFWSCLTRLC